MKNLRNAFGLLGLLAVAGCGCTEDSTIERISPSQNFPAFRDGVRIRPIPVRRAEAVKVDVLFLIDDSSSFATGFLAGDGRLKSVVAQQVMRDVQQKLLADLGSDPRTNDRDFDLAFGVARFEDYGGAFRAPVPNSDDVARPYILQMPIYRQQRDGFAARFEVALTTSTPGRGDIPPAPPSFPFWRPDAATGMEALFQAATGNGFDGDNDANKAESGAAGVAGTVGNPGSGYVSPGSSGDVPTAPYVGAGNDEDGEPAFTTGGGATPSSGNVGGAGWRPASIRFVILATDAPTVSPFDGELPPAAVLGKGGASVQSAALRSLPVGVTDPRWGTSSTVGPVGRADVQDVIDALVGLDIEVLGIGTQNSAPRPGKPNQPGDPADNVYPAGPVAAVPSPVLPDVGPFTWLSAAAILTGARDVVEVGEMAAADMPLVYNLLTVFPTGSIEPTIDVREDLVDRISVRLPAPPAPQTVDPLLVDLTMKIQSTGVNPYVFSIQGGAPSTTATRIQQVSVPRYFIGDPVPQDVVLRWLVQSQPQTVDPDNPLPGAADISFSTSEPIPGFVAPSAKVGLLTPAAATPVPAPSANLTQVVASDAGCFYWEAVAPTTSNVAPGEICSNYP